MAWMEDYDGCVKTAEAEEQQACKHRRLEFMMWEAFYLYDQEAEISDGSNGGTDLKQVLCIDCGKRWDDHAADWPEMKEMFYQKVV